MWICHKLVVSYEATVLQACHVSDVHATSAVHTMQASWEIVCRWAPHPVLAITSGFSNTITRQRRLTTTAVWRRSCGTHENCMHAEQIIIIFYLIFFIFCSLYLLLFLIVLYRTRVTFYTNCIYPYNYLWQMHRIIHLSPVGCFTPARGKTVPKNREVSGVKRVQRVTPDLIKDTQDCHGSTMRNVTLKHYPVRNRAQLTARFTSLWCVSAAEHQTAKQYSKTGRTKPRKHLSRSDLSWNTRHDFLKIPSLCEAALETERRCFSKVIFESNVTPKITRLSDSFSTVVLWGCIVRDLETIIVLLLAAFNFIPQRSHHSLTLPRSRIRDSATATLTPGDGTTAIKVESSA